MAKRRANGEGSISKRKDGTWCAVLTLGLNPRTGKQKRKFYYGRTQKEVKEKLARAQVEIQNGTFVDNHKITVGEWLNRWLEEYARPHIRPATWKSYEENIRLHINPAIGHIKLKDLKSSDLQRHYNDKFRNGRVDGTGGLSARSVQLIHAPIHAALKQAMNEGLIMRNVSEATKLPRGEKKDIKVLTPDEQGNFLTVLSNDRLGIVFLVDLGTGLRVSELLALQWQDVDLEAKTIRVHQALTRVRIEGQPTKTALRFQPLKTANSKRSISLPEPVVIGLRHHKARQNEEKLRAGQGYTDHGLVFCSELGQPIDPRNLTRKLDQLLQKAGVPRTNMHALRHTYATRLLEKNEHPKVVQELLGHSQISLTLDTYSHVMPEIKQKAAEKLNDVLSTKNMPSLKERQ
jgi:integrase